MDLSEETKQESQPQSDNKTRFLKPGTVINNTYRIERFIASGSVGEVYLCVHQHLEGPQFAMKVFHFSGGQNAIDPAAAIRFKKEVEISFDLNHPNVVGSYAFVREENFIAVVLEYVSGGDLGQYLSKHKQLPVEDTTKILSQACAGLQAIHEVGITHRDVKPENFLLAEDGEVKITDFGIARIKDGQNLTAHGSLLGTMEYLSPEYLLEGKCDNRSDIYALGLIGYEMLTGKQPFVGNTMMEALQKKMNSLMEPVCHARRDCPQILGDAIHKALEPKPEDRFQTVAEMIAAMKESPEPEEAASTTVDGDDYLRASVDMLHEQFDRKSSGSSLFSTAVGSWKSSEEETPSDAVAQETLPPPPAQEIIIPTIEAEQILEQDEGHYDEVLAEETTRKTSVFRCLADDLGQQRFFPRPKLTGNKAFFLFIAFWFLLLQYYLL